MTGQSQQNQNNAISLSERQAIQKTLSDPTQFTGPDGTVDWNKAMPLVMKVAPTTGMDVVGKMMLSQQAATSSKQLITNLDASKRQALGQVAQSLQGQPQETIDNTFDALSKQSPELATAMPMVRQVLKHAAEMNGQKGIDTALGHLAQMGMTPTDQQTFNTPNALPIGNGIQTAALNTKPGVNGIGQGEVVPGTAQTQLVPLANQQGTGTDLQGNAVVTRKDAYGNVQAPTAMPGTAPGTPSPMVNYPAGESSDTKSALEKEHFNAKNVAMSAPAMHANNQGILHELDNVTATGVSGNFIARAESLFGAGNVLGSTEAEKAASAYDLIGKYTERNALQAAASMGPQTNAGLEAQIKANGAASYNPTALKTVTKLNDAVITGSEKYAQGLQTAVDTGGKGVFSKRQFDQQWAQNADMNTLRYVNAFKTGDQAEAAAILKSVGGPGSTGAKKLAQQLQNLNSLTTRGHL